MELSKMKIFVIFYEVFLLLSITGLMIVTMILSNKKYSAFIIISIISMAISLTLFLLTIIFNIYNNYKFSYGLKISSMRGISIMTELIGYILGRCAITKKRYIINIIGISAIIFLIISIFIDAIIRDQVKTNDINHSLTKNQKEDNKDDIYNKSEDIQQTNEVYVDINKYERIN